MFFYTKYIKEKLPYKFHKKITNQKEIVLDKVKAVRASKLATKIFGPQYKRSRKNIELDITYECNLGCKSCNRSCPQARTQERMTIDQIEKFIQESLAKGIIWEKISLVGGEPTLHPDFLKIAQLLVDYKKRYAGETLIWLKTNGFGLKVQKVLEKVPPEIEIISSEKESSIQDDFVNFNIAPKDTGNCQGCDYINGCVIMEYCGIGLNPYGYYPCAVAAGIDRIFGFNLGRKKIPEFTDDMPKELRIFCSLCGHFKRSSKLKNGKDISPVWEKAYRDYKSHVPVMDRY